MGCAVNMVPYFNHCFTTVWHHASVAFLGSGSGGGGGGDYGHFW